MIRSVGLGEFYRAVSDLHRRLCDFIHAIVVHRRDEAIGREEGRGVAELGSGVSHGASL